MAEIDVNKAMLVEKIDKLNTLRNDEAIRMTRPDIRGGGSNVNMMESLSDFYEDMYDNLLKLYDNSIGFLKNLSESIPEADEQASNAYE